MMETYIILILAAALSLSLTLNGVMVWYARRLIQNIVLYTEGVDTISDSIEDKLVELDRFSRKELILNDPDVAFVINLIKESKEELSSFRNSFTIVDVDTIETEFGEEDE